MTEKSVRARNLEQHLNALKMITQEIQNEEVVALNATIVTADGNSQSFKTVTGGPMAAIALLGALDLSKAELLDSFSHNLQEMPDAATN